MPRLNTNSRAAFAGAKNAEAAAGMVPAERENLLPPDDDALEGAAKRAPGAAEAADERAPAERPGLAGEPEQVLSPQQEKRAELLERFKELRADGRKEAKGRVRKVDPADEPDEDAEADAGDGAAAAAQESQEELDEERRELQERAAGARGQDKAARGKPAARQSAEDGTDTGDGGAEEFTLTVDGRDETVSRKEAVRRAGISEATAAKLSRDELAALAQIRTASDNRLEESKKQLDESRRVVAEAREVVSKLRPADADPENPPAAKPKGPKTNGAAAADSGKSDPENPPEDDAELLAEFEELADQIQVGDRAEGARALAKAIKLAQDKGLIGPQGTPTQTGEADIERQVSRVLTKERVTTEISSAIADLGKTYPDLVNDELLAESGMTAVRKEIVKDLKELGIEDEALKPIARNSEALLKAYVELRQAGRKVRSPGEIFRSAGEMVAKRFNLQPAEGREDEPAGQSPRQPARQPAGRQANGSANGAANGGAGRSQQHTDTDTGRGARSDQAQQVRIERKRALTPQPRAAGVRSQMPKGPKPKTGMEILQDMRVARNFQRTM